MALTAFDDLQRYRERAPAIMTADWNGSIAAHCGDEALQLARERLGAIADERDALDQILNANGRQGWRRCIS
jgi:hypothetical protein